MNISTKMVKDALFNTFLVLLVLGVPPLTIGYSMKRAMNNLEQFEQSSPVVQDCKCTN